MADSREDPAFALDLGVATSDAVLVRREAVPLGVTEDDPAFAVAVAAVPRRDVDDDRAMGEGRVSVLLDLPFSPRAVLISEFDDPVFASRCFVCFMVMEGRPVNAASGTARLSFACRTASSRSSSSSSLSLASSSTSGWWCDTRPLGSRGGIAPDTTPARGRRIQPANQPEQSSLNTLLATHSRIAFTYDRWMNRRPV